MRLILHIGMPKTGTSTLQGALLANRDLLAEARTIYPEPLFGKLNHNTITSLVQPMEEMPREFASGGEDFEAIEARGDEFTFDAIRERGQQFWRAVCDQVASADREVIILSGEYCYGLADHKLEALRSMLTELTDDIHVVCYVRHPCAYYVSLTQQMVKAAHQIQEPARYRMRARECLTRFLGTFDGRVSVRPYDRHQLVGNDIVADFVTTFVPGGDVLASRMAVTDQNESMSAEAMCIVQRLRRHQWPDQNGQFAPESTHVRRVLDDLWQDDDQTPAMLDPELDAWMVQRHRGDLRFLRDEFGIDFGGADGPSGDAPDVPAATSQDLVDILDVDEERIERTLYALVRSLAEGDLDPGHERSGLRAEGTPQ